ncbi:hypothetical protein HELRODRAFT_158078 [Helobdella robusta]|uniref:Protein Wnt n=1 Tax=Helobdella robusta TaxID=6412 RepID=T1EMJ1_HELRO|nr:hypothetical protein HELRODRAFT_158078 [Helobdella robusta]ESN90988.1 hypothetical protein HELRODRAFT_158078 [Helobdella robusta]
MTFSCNTMNVLSYGQMKFCQLYEDHMIGVVKAAQMGIGECQHQFKDRRWNCTVMPKEPSVFGKVATRATRESAFLHAMMSAGVVHSISRMCRDGELTGCGCSKKKRPKKAIRPEWIWGGCGDNTDYGYKFSGGFVDVMEKEKNHPRKSPGLSRMLMNLHNNEVGRRAVYRHVKIGCKCHGTSGSCSVRTCWNQLPSFRQTGDRLRDRYDAAAQVTFNPQGTRLIPINRKFNRPTKDDLIFTEPSPNFCNPDPERGSLGTSGRVCDRRSQGTSGCGLMCCDRGYRSSKVKYVERCKCKFHWCCNVSCQTCERSMHVHTCN